MLRGEGPSPSPSQGEGNADGVSMIGDVISEDVLWSCTTCRACEEHCPVGIEHVDTIVDMRRNLVLEQGQMPETAEAALRSLEQRGHPWRGTQETRTTWTEGLDIPFIADHPDAEYLFWVGCTGALVERNVQVTPRAGHRSQARRRQLRHPRSGRNLHRRSGAPPGQRISLPIAGTTEHRHPAGPQRAQDRHPLPTLLQHPEERIPAVRRPLRGHPSQPDHRPVLAAGRLTPTQASRDKITYHDACYLGRHNGVFTAPRQAIGAIPGAQMQEMQWNQRRGLCCGAGGGHAFMEVNIGQRVNHIRTEQAIETGANVVATGCPFCMQMFADGVKAKGVEETLRVQDIAELVADSLPPDAEEPSP